MQCYAKTHNFFLVQITRRIKRTLKKEVVDHTVAERKTWSKFGQEKGNKPGPDRATTTVGESVALKLSAGNKVRHLLLYSMYMLKTVNRSPAIRTRTYCRAGDEEQSCEGRCRQGCLSSLQGRPFHRKMSLQGLPPRPRRHRCAFSFHYLMTDLITIFVDTPPFGGDDAPAPEPAAPTTGGKYVPPSMRGARGPGEAMGRPGGSRDDMPTLRVTNISEDTQENDLRELFSTFGRIARVYVGRDRETGIGKGFAFVSFEEKSQAQKAMEKMHGRGYDNLILSVQWSRKFTFSILRVWIMLIEMGNRTKGTAISIYLYRSCIQCFVSCILSCCNIDLLPFAYSATKDSSHFSVSLSPSVSRDAMRPDCALSSH